MSNTTMASDISLRSPSPKAIPHAFVILFVLAVLAALITWVIPSGSYERVVNEDGRSVIVAGTYHLVEHQAIGPLAFFNAFFEGMKSGSSIIFFLVIVGGTFGVMRRSQALEGLVNLLLLRLAGREILIIPLMMTFFALCSATYGMIEGSIVYIFILLPLARRAGYDAVVAAAIPLIGTAIGYTGSFLNPFNVGVAQSIAELPLFSGMGYRMFCWLLFVALSAGYVMFYAQRVKRDPSRSVIADLAVPEQDIAQSDLAKLEPRHLGILAAFGVALAVIIIGVSSWGWYLKEMAGIFLILGIASGIIARMPANDIALTFSDGCKDMVDGALAVGMAFTIVVIVQQSMTIDTIIHSLVSVVGDSSSNLAALGMYASQSLMNFVVTSGSGQAALTMPIMTPLADLAGVDRQVAVLAFQFGDGISNAFTPTAGWLIAGLTIAGVPWARWMRFMLPLILMLYSLGVVLVVVANTFIWTGA
ncbi:YfcC family protein [Pseudomonas sp. NPDC078700]|uniref:YfcC family protein n=1 Tax=Pseudomonas sp. NPDC078700 TaxID=3364424 RepID=UPI0037C6B126